MTTVEHRATARPAVGTTAVEDMRTEDVERIMEAEVEHMKIATEDTSQCMTETEAVLQNKKID